MNHKHSFEQFDDYLADREGIYDYRAVRYRAAGLFLSDSGISSVDLNTWVPERKVEFAVALEIMEHLHDPVRLIKDLKKHVNRGIVISVPNPRTVDVIGIDKTHVTVVTREMLESQGFSVVEKTFYGGVFSNGEPDALFATYLI